VDPFYITTPIYYVNDVPHVGHAYTTIAADSLARWNRLLGRPVFFLTGTDEHGDKIARSAAVNNSEPKTWVDNLAPRFQSVWSKLSISYDDFIRTTEDRHIKCVQNFLGKIYENGYIDKQVYNGWYCYGCEAYKDEEDLIQGRLCKDHGNKVEYLSEENYFFKLSQFQEKLLKWYEENPDAIRPDTRRNEAVSFVKSGLKDISITRTSTKWGVEVPWDPSHVFYVWYDALVNYLTAIGYASDQEKFNFWWPYVHHVMAKDIIRFHCVWWPAMCMAAGIKPPANIFVHGYLLLGGERLSKTRIKESGTFNITHVSPDSLTEDFGVDPVRYALLRGISFGQDGEFSYESINNRYNTDLANNLGNLLQRVVTLVISKCDGLTKAPDPESPLKDYARKAVEENKNYWATFGPHLALEATWNFIRQVNAHLELKEPWKLDRGKAVDSILGDALEALRFIAVLIEPAMPNISNLILKRIGIDKKAEDFRIDRDLAWGQDYYERTLVKGDPIFPRRQIV
jgi:methionyl-tRNA synthetase